MKFLADMGISPRTVDLLRTLGHDARHLMDENLERLSDRDVLAKAKREECILLTHDLDFGELLAASGAKLPSVIIFRLRNMRPEHVNEYLRALLAEHTDILERGAIVSVAEGRIRIRSLPFGEDP